MIMFIEHFMNNGYGCNAILCFDHFFLLFAVKGIAVQSNDGRYHIEIVFDPVVYFFKKHGFLSVGFIEFLKCFNDGKMVHEAKKVNDKSRIGKVEESLLVMDERICWIVQVLYVKQGCHRYEEKCSQQQRFFHAEKNEGGQRQKEYEYNRHSSKVVEKDNCKQCYGDGECKHIGRDFYVAIPLKMPQTKKQYSGQAGFDCAVGVSLHIGIYEYGKHIDQYGNNVKPVKQNMFRATVRYSKK